MLGNCRVIALLLTSSLLVGACSSASPPMPDRAPSAASGSGVTSSQPSIPKRIVAAIAGDPYTLSAKLNTSGPGSNVAGTDALEDLVNAGLANMDNQSQLHAVLADAVPTIENGQSKLLPDGRMETTWRLRPNTFWHDGVPFTSDDLLFTAQVSQNPEVGWEHDAAFDAIESVAAPDSRTLTVTWKRPFVEADTLFSHAVSGRTVPLPRHLLGQAFAEDPANLMNQPYWSEQFVGTGPFKLRTWERGNHLIVDANDQYVLGRPKIDEVEVKIFSDPRTLTASILAGAIDLTMGRGISLEQAAQIRDQWPGGHMDLRLNNAIIASPQLLDATPPVVMNLQFRRALLMALDRQQMVDTFQFGLTSVAHSYLSTEDPAYPEIAPTVPHYDYDPRRAMQMIEGLGYTRGADGLYHDASGQPITLEVRVSAGNDVTEKSTLAVADAWRQVGVAADARIDPAQRSRDREYAATFPSFFVQQNPNDPARLNRLSSAQVPTAANRFIGANTPRYANSDFDALLQRYGTTIPLPARRQVLGQIVDQIADQVIQLGLFYISEPTLIANRVLNATARPPASTQAWNAVEWDVKQ
ncbi:MAG: peptide/nickel transport system substrate-binding protein [Chloroflexota bacterium]|jgi:peptide/nickel transport system substrate-binding protein|nr:peptide/nickel transport system substrate-binding protein [Chloroflexota bacterium]